jgi:hypothetical protein
LRFPFLGLYFWRLERGRREEEEEEEEEVQLVQHGAAEPKLQFSKICL